MEKTKSREFYQGFDKQTEDSIERCLVNVDVDSEGDWAEILRRGLKEGARKKWERSRNQQGDLFSINPFLEMRYHLSDGEFRILPQYTPKNHFKGEVINCQPLFNGEAHVVTVYSGGKYFPFVDTSPKKRQVYEQVLGTQVKFDLAAVSCGPVNTYDFESPRDKEWLAGETFLSEEIGRTALFRFKEILKKRDKFCLMSVFPPFSNEGELELITNLENMNPKNISEGINAGFYFIGEMSLMDQ